MITYTKRIYPELTQQDFDEIIVPLIDNVSILEAHYYEHINTPFNTSSSEDYPYYNVCMTFANQLWEKVWTKSLDQTVKHARTFKMMTIQILSQLVFTYLIRCFSEDIKVQPIQESPEETYKAYSQSLLNDGLKRFSCKYPVAWGRINQLLENKMMALVKVIKNIVKDRQIIADKFGISIASRIETLVSEGDSHNHGSAVTIITFECGSKLVYKPRSVSGEVAYGKLLVRLNPNLCEPMMAAEALECEGYGYTGFLKSSPENSNMYQAGRLACLLYLLNATDMHYSNILWTEKGPIPIDLETLFHPRRIRTGTKESEKSAYMALETSVYGTGVLPLILTSKNSKGSVDVGLDRKSVV